jgi:hypothetical protein
MAVDEPRISANAELTQVRNTGCQTLTKDSRRGGGFVSSLPFNVSVG